MTQKSKFEIAAEEIGSLVTEKNKFYGDSFAQTGEFLKILYPKGIPVEAYTDALCLVRMFDKMKRIATHKNAYGESSYKDLAGYSILGYVKDSEELQSEEVEESSSTSSDIDPVLEPSKLFFNDEAIKNFKVVKEEKLHHDKNENKTNTSSSSPNEILLECIAKILKEQLDNEYVKYLFVYTNEFDPKEKEIIGRVKQVLTRNSGIKYIVVGGDSFDEEIQINNILEIRQFRGKEASFGIVLFNKFSVITRSINLMNPSIFDKQMQEGIKLLDKVDPIAYNPEASFSADLFYLKNSQEIKDFVEWFRQNTKVPTPISRIDPETNEEYWAIDVHVNEFNKPLELKFKNKEEVNGFLEITSKDKSITPDEVVKKIQALMDLSAEEYTKTLTVEREERIKQKELRKRANGTGNLSREALLDDDDAVCMDHD